MMFSVLRTLWGSENLDPLVAHSVTSLTVTVTLLTVSFSISVYVTEKKLPKIPRCIICIIIYVILELVIKAFL